jgi:lipopolysaccharide export system protein LptA
MRNFRGLSFFAFFALSLLILFKGGMSGDFISAAERERTLFFEAGRQETKIENGGTFLKNYYDNVRAWTDDGLTEIKGDAAEYNSSLKEGRFYGHASFRDSTRTLRADTLLFNETTNELMAIGNVVGNEKDRTFWADRVGYRRNIRLVRATGGVVVRDDSLKSSVHGVSAVFNDSTGNGFIFGKPVLVREDDKGGIVTVAAEDTIDVNKQKRIITIWNGVSVLKDSLKAYSGKTVYDDSLGVMIMTVNPRVYHTMTDDSDNRTLTANSIITGDSITVFLKERKITGAEVNGKAREVTVWTDSLQTVYGRSVLESGQITLNIENNMITGMKAKGNANTYYFRKPTDSDKLNVNQAVGDTIIFFFDKGRIQRLLIEGRSGADASGKYYEFSPGKKKPEKSEAVEKKKKK